MTILRKAIKIAKEQGFKQKARDLILLKFAIGMFIYVLIITFTFLFISYIGSLII